MKKALVLTSLLLASCAGNVNNLEIPTSDTAAYKHKEFKQRVEVELSPKDYKLLKRYMLKNEDSAVSVAEAIKLQKQADDAEVAKLQKAKEDALKQNIQATKERIEAFKILSKKAYLATRGLDESKLTGLVSNDIELSNFRLDEFKMNKIPYLSPDNPNKYRYILKYRFDISNKKHYDVRSVVYEFSLKYDVEDVDVSKKSSISTYFTKSNGTSKYIQFSFTSGAKITREEMQTVLPLYRVVELKDMQYKNYTLEDFANYKEKLQFRLSKMQEKLKQLESADKTPYNFEKRFSKYFTLSPKLYSKDKEEFKEYLVKHSGF